MSEAAGLFLRSPHSSGIHDVGGAHARARSRPKRSPRSRALLAHKKLIVERVESVEGRKQEPCLNTYTQKCELDPAGFKFGRRIRTQRCLS